MILWKDSSILPFEISPDLWRKVGADLPSGTCVDVHRLAQAI